MSLLIRYLGQNYTSAHWDVQYVVDQISPHVDTYLIPHLIRVMTAGCPNILTAVSSRENLVKYWQTGNNLSIAKHLPAATKTMNKEERNTFFIPLLNVDVVIYSSLSLHAKSLPPQEQQDTPYL